MNEILTAAVLTVVTAAIVLILVLTARRRRASSSAPGNAVSVSAIPRRPCPLCGAHLEPGERIRSTTRLSPTQGRIMEISGCPHCLALSPRPRICPVCGAQLGPREVLVARYTDLSRADARPHVHVLGCTRCRGG